MKVICAPDKFKGSLTAAEAAAAMRRGIERVGRDIEIDLCPISDGGEGFIETLQAATGGFYWRSTVSGPRVSQVDATWLCLPKQNDQPLTAAIEMARASGLQLLAPALRDPMKTTTYGTGQLMLEALHVGNRRLLVGIGGSATCDGGTGMAEALGARFLDERGEMIGSLPCGGVLQQIRRIDLNTTRKLVDGCEIIAACDVTNPLHGPNGAALVFAPQKGATPEQVRQLDDGLCHLARVVREELSVDYENHPGAGAAGGLGFGLLAFLGAKLMRGIDLVLDAVRFDDRLRSCDLCLTGEGKLDGQSLSGKACIGVAQAAAKRGVPTVALVGAAGDGSELALAAGLSSYHVIGEGLSSDESMRRASELLERATERVVRERIRA